MEQIEKSLENQLVLGGELENILRKLQRNEVRHVQLESTKARANSVWMEFLRKDEALSAGAYNHTYWKCNYKGGIEEIMREIEILIQEKMAIDAKKLFSSTEEVEETGKVEETEEVEATEESEEVASENDGQEDEAIRERLQRLVFTRYVSTNKKLGCAQKEENRIGMHESIVARFKQVARSIEESLETTRKELYSCTKVAAEVRKNDLQNAYIRFEQAYDKVEVLQFQEEFYNTFDKIRSKYYEVEILIAEKLESFKGNSPMMQQSFAKLQEIKVPIFEGQKEAWASFYNVFEMFVHKSDASNVEKMLRLKAALRGEAAKHIQHLTITSDNYTLAWESLQQRYENHRLTYETLVDRLLDQPTMNSESSVSIRQLLDTTQECVKAIAAMGLVIDDSTTLIARIVMRKFDREAMRQYEFNIRRTREIQMLDDVFEFLEKMAQAQEALKGKRVGPQYQHRVATKTSHYITEQTCSYCHMKMHKIAECEKFKELSVQERRSWVSKSNACWICLYHTKAKRCFQPTKKCVKCNKLHHGLLHLDFTPSNHDKPTFGKANGNKINTYVTKEDESGVTFLATAHVRVKNIFGEFITLRALIDQGSQKTAISEEAAQILQLPKKKKRTELYGLGDTLVGVSKSEIKLEILPRLNNKDGLTVEALWDNYSLADPEFNKSSRIDILIGVDLFHKILEDGVRKIGNVIGQATKLGWMISGVLKESQHQKKIVSAVTTTLERFWEIEEIPETNENDKDECISFFEKTTTLNKDNRFVVKLPFYEDRVLGNSKKQAMARFLSLERRLKKDEKLRQKYIEFMRDYEKMGHMLQTISDSGKYYMPHQSVYREDSITTNVRVVFDASAKSSNGSSLNDVLKVGPKLQNDIFDIMVKWRLWCYVLSADVEKMYRQILIHEDDQQYQHILWREDKSMPIKEFKLTTVTYGTTSAPFLAKQTLAQIGAYCDNDELKRIIINDFYMDDLMTGANTINECKELQIKLSNQLEKYGFRLRKWMSNNKYILSTIPNKGNLDLVPIDNDNETVKTLGLQWNPMKDVFVFVLKANNEKRVTKRKALSTLAKIFDPLGWLTPLTTCIKLFIQKLWLMQTDWDKQLDDDLQKEWDVIINSLSYVKNISIPRWYNTNTTTFEIHGFADASQKAYAAVVYLKVGSTVSLVAGKSKVNPVKNRKTLPKLELCAAHLLSRLVKRILQTLQRDVAVVTWSDSTITLAWISNNKSKDRFIRSKVDDIKKLLPMTNWRHIDSKNNPADAASRGVTADKINTLWWNGPSWLSTDEANWPTQIHQTISVVTNVQPKDNWLEAVSERCSSFQKLERVIAYVNRFVGILKGDKYPNYLTSNELKKSNSIIIKQHQKEHFFSEMQSIRQHNSTNTKSKIANLHPFLDDVGILRVGGRLENAEIPYVQKHPILLEKSWLAELVVKDVHNATLHGGNNLVASTIRRKFWVIGMKNMIKKVLRYCVRCIRYRKEGANQIMGNLPTSRVVISHPFTHSGVDYAGPIQMRCSRGRGQKSYKGYIAVFVCMATKAIHLEAVSDLTTDAFLGALRRFFARRGKATCLYSDNGTNFVGAARRLDEDFKRAIKNNHLVGEALESEKIQWHFIPPASPHFGGIWEAGVKSVKHHLRRVIGDSTLTYEEMATLLAQIEAVLNSRPLCAITESPDEIDVLTPGHFLIGQPLIGLPEVNEEFKSSLDRWKLIQKMRRDFWNRWKNEYMFQLQQRNKWRQDISNLKENQICIIKDESTQPAKWPLGRIIETHEGKDGKVRVATLKTQNGMLKRPIHKLCPLQPVNEDQNKDDIITTRGSHVTTTLRSKRTNVTFHLLWFLFMLVNSVQPVQVMKVGGMVRELGNGTILYMDKIGTMNRETSSWNLVTYYDMEAYFMTIDQINKTLSRCREVCMKLRTFEEQCSVVLDSMEDRLKTIKENDKLFAHQDKDRVKRSPFDFVGSFYHVLFGMMDSEDREMIQDNMRSVIENEHNLKHLVEKQTSVVESTLNILKKTTNEVKLQFNNINERVNNISETINTDYFVYKESINFFMMTRQLEILVDDAEKIQIQVIGLLMDINHGKINPNLIRPEQLHQEMFKIKENLSAKMRLPGKSKETVLQAVYRLMTARGIFVDGKLVIDIKIPLLERQSSDIFHILPLPITKDGRKMQALLRQQFVVYNYEADAYHLTSQPMLNQCQKDGDEEFMCKGNWAWEDANDHSCELASLKPSNPYSCSYAEIHSTNIWLELHAKSNWLFRIFENATAHIVCDKNNQEIIQLPMQGILTLNAGCTARIGRTTLTSLQDVKTEEFNEFRTFLFKDVKDVELIKPLNSSMLNHTEEIDALIKEINVIKSENIKLKSLNWHQMSGHSSLTLILIAIIIFSIIFIKRKCENKKKVVDLRFNLPRQNV